MIMQEAFFIFLKIFSFAFLRAVVRNSHFSVPRVLRSVCNVLTLGLFIFKNILGTKQGFFRPPGVTPPPSIAGPVRSSFYRHFAQIPARFCYVKKYRAFSLRLFCGFVSAIHNILCFVWQFSVDLSQLRQLIRC